MVAGFFTVRTATPVCKEWWSVIICPSFVFPGRRVQDGGHWIELELRDEISSPHSNSPRGKSISTAFPTLLLTLWR